MGHILSLRHYREDVIAHVHDHAQVMINVSGALDVEIEGRASLLRQQHVMVIPAGAHHACDSAHGSRCLLGTAGQHTLDPRQEQLVQWLAASPVADPLIARQGAILLLASLNTPAQSPRAHLPFARLDAYIDQHAAYPLQVADLAQVADLSCARLHSRFISECGQTPMEYVRQRRLRHALHLLRQTSLAVGDVASRVGYGSQSAFAAAMLREFGASPRALRREPDDN